MEPEIEINPSDVYGMIQDIVFMLGGDEKLMKAIENPLIPDNVETIKVARHDLVMDFDKKLHVISKRRLQSQEAATNKS